MNLFFSGALTMAYVMATLFFLRFYRQTKETLFVHFAACFALLTVSRIALTAADEEEQHHALYLLRLLAFLVLLVGIWRKNRGPGSRG